MRILLTLLFGLFLGYYATAQDSNVHSVYFSIDAREPSQEQVLELKDWLSQFTDTLKKVEVIGFTDYLHTDDYNLTLSEDRANFVMQVIENQNLLRYRMSLVSANGEKNAVQPIKSQRGNAEDRRVDVIVFPREKKPVLIERKESATGKPQKDLLETVETGQTIVLKNMNFFPGRHFLIPKAESELKRLAHVLDRNPTMQIEIQGHICCKLDSLDAKDIDTQTRQLSFNRAKYIHDQLSFAGIDSTRMSYRGFAGSRPLFKPELTQRHRNLNRRVEIKVLHK
ncbi:MAG: OmpA family protein [Flavobacteriales bacterium]